MSDSSHFLSLQVLVNKAIADRRLSQAERDQIMQAILADKQVSPEEQQLLGHLADQIRSGEIQTVD
ncbi:MAG: hypothetical protein HC921_08190 [Synechococcaceae cyanobacterium SM2_3_1]|nr:hypothetical protein [Synechococcaceae cyanobacterium SM2_3_1]